jgi:hypothetical protein
MLLPGLPATGQQLSRFSPVPGYEPRIREYVDSLRVIDTHEHLFTPEMIKGMSTVDFMLLFLENGYNDLLSAGMPAGYFDKLFNSDTNPVEKWKLIEPYWKQTFNTTFSRITLLAVKNLYGINDLNESTVTELSEKINKAYNTGWFDQVMKDSCRIDYIIQDGYRQQGKDNYFRYAKRFDSWLLVKSKYLIDSIAILQLDPIYNLEDYVASMQKAFEDEVKKGMSAVKIAISYSRTLSTEKVETETAKKIFHRLVSADEDFVMPFKDAKPLQDYMIYELLKMADKYKLPVAIHTGLQAGKGNLISNSNPVLLAPLFKEFPGINFALFHGSYPYGGELSTLAKTFRNVYIDMNWMYAISPNYSERYLSEWLDVVPVGKLMAFGGDFMVPESVYGELLIARAVISDVLIRKVRDGYLSEAEAKLTAKMILYDNSLKFYNLK